MKTRFNIYFIHRSKNWHKSKFISFTIFKFHSCKIFLFQNHKSFFNKPIFPTFPIFLDTKLNSHTYIYIYTIQWIHVQKIDNSTQRWFLFFEYWLHRGSNCQTRDISWNINESIPRLSLWSLRYSFRISWTPQNSSPFERERGRIVSRHTEILVDGPPLPTVCRSKACFPIDVAFSIENTSIRVIVEPVR